MIGRFKGQTGILIIFRACILIMKAQEFEKGHAAILLLMCHKMLDQQRQAQQLTGFGSRKDVKPQKKYDHCFSHKTSRV